MDTWIKHYITYRVHCLTNDPSTMDINHWKYVLDQLKYPILYYVFRTKDTKSVSNEIFPIQTFQEYVDSIANIKKMGSYDYMDFCNQMKTKDYKKTIFNKYEMQQKINRVKNEIIDYVLSTRPGDIDLTGLKEYLSQQTTTAKPDIQQFRKNMNLFYEKYTLWEIQQQTI